MKASQLIGPYLTVIIRNDTPIIHCNDVPSYRSVTITLTAEQMEKLRLQDNEAISHSFIEIEP